MFNVATLISGLCPLREGLVGEHSAFFRSGACWQAEPGLLQSPVIEGPGPDHHSYAEAHEAALGQAATQCEMTGPSYQVLVRWAVCLTLLYVQYRACSQRPPLSHVGVCVPDLACCSLYVPSASCTHTPKTQTALWLPSTLSCVHHPMPTLSGHPSS